MKKTGIFPLEAWRRLSVELIWCYEGTVPVPGLEVRSTESHEVVWQVVRGEARVDRNGRVFRVKAGDWVFLPRGPRRHVLSPDNRLLSIHFRADWPWGGPVWDPDDPVIFPARRSSGFDKRARALQAVLGLRQSDIATRGSRRIPMRKFFALQAAFQQWLGALGERLSSQGVAPAAHAPSDPRVGRALRLLNDAPLDRPPAGGLVARVAGVSPAQCNRLFHAAVGMSPRRFFEMRRWRSAQDALADPSVAIKAVSIAHGFRDLTAFSRWCKRMGGHGPRRLRGRLLAAPRA